MGCLWPTLTALPGLFLQNQSVGGPTAAKASFSSRLGGLVRGITALTSKHVFHSPEVLKDNPCFDPFRESLSASKVLLPGDLPFRCSVGEFEDAEGNVYLFIQNRDYYEKRPFTLQLNRDYRVYQVSCLDGFQHLSEEAASYLTLRLDPGDAQLIRLQAPAEEACLIDYVLQK